MKKYALILMTILISGMVFGQSKKVKALTVHATQDLIVDEVSFDGVDGTSGQVLTTNGSGALSFQDAGGVGDVTAAVNFSDDNSFIISDGTEKGVKSVNKSLLSWTSNNLQIGVAASNTQTNYEDSGVVINLSVGLDKGRLERITSPITSETNVFTLSGTSTVNTAKEALLIDGNTDRDLGTVPVSIIMTRNGSTTINNRPTLSGYNYTTKQWEVSSAGTWDYQGNAISGIGIISAGEQSSDPADPLDGYVLWQSDGTGTGDDGDVLIKVNAGGVTKTLTLIDFSAL